MMPVVRLRPVGQVEYEAEVAVLDFERRWRDWDRWRSDPFGWWTQTVQFLGASGLLEAPS
jgi:hypothetical protein